MTTLSTYNLKNVSFLLVGILAIVFSIRNIYGEDIGFHLQSAKWMIENRAFPANDTFTYTATNNAYIDLNWIYQLLNYFFYSIAESIGLIFLNSFLIISSIYFVIKRSKYNSWIFFPWLLLLSIIAVSPLFEIRPHAVSWLFLNISLYILQEYYDGNKKIIKWLPFIMLFWVNMHSLFILGLVCLGCYFISIYINKKTLIKETLKWGSLSVLICFINPYGWKGFYLPFQQLGAIQAGNIFKENIKELQSPIDFAQYAGSLFDILFKKWIYFDLFVLIFIILIIVNFKRYKLHHFLLFIIFFYFAFSATKNSGYFIFAVTPFLALRNEELFFKKTKKENRFINTLLLQPYKRGIHVSFIVIALMLILSIYSNAFYINYQSTYRFGFSWSNNTLPVNAVNFLQKNNSNGKILNQLDFGGYLEYFAQQKTAIDGRLDVMGTRIFKEHVFDVKDEQKNFLIEKHRPSIIIISYFITPDWITFLQKKEEWRLVYLDESSIVYFKNDYMTAIPALTEQKLLSELKNYSDTQMDAMLKINRDHFFLSSLFNKQYFPQGEMNEIVFCFYYGWMDAAKQIAGDALNKCTQNYPEMYQNIGSIYFQKQDRDKSLFCYEKFLETRKNAQIEKRVQFLKSL